MSVDPAKGGRRVVLTPASEITPEPLRCQHTWDRVIRCTRCGFIPTRPSPSAEAACDHAKHLPSPGGYTQEGDTATCRCGLRVVAVHEESEGAWWEADNAES